MNETLLKNGLELAKQVRRYLELGDLDQAERLCKEAMREFGEDPDLLLQAGNVHYFRKRYAEAAHYYRQVQVLRPKDSDVRTMLWGTYRDAGDFEKMLQLAQEFQEHPLNDNELFFAYRTYIALCDWQRAADVQERALKLLREGRISHGLISAMLIDLCSIPDLPPELVYEIHRLWGADEAKKREPYFSANTPIPPVEGRLKIAYISADFNAHPVGAFMNQIIRSHDRSRFEIYCYAYLERNDAFTQNFRDHAEHFIDITAMRHDEVAKRIHDDGIHLLIELGGHTTNSRLAVLAYKPAPVQLTYLGYPNTTGLPTVDYRITDPFAESPEGTRYVEKLLCMPQSFLCYGTGLAQQPADAAPVTKKGHITFASLNHIRKLTPEAIRAWSRILDRVPDSRLLMKARAVESGSSLILENVLAEFERHGVKRERIEFLPFTDSHKEHMLQYNEIDVALDSFPYNGTTTTCDALIMGVPVVTLVGTAHAQRVSYSILKNIGFEETVTHNVDDYVEKAVMLASRPEYLTMLRQILPTLFRHSILCQSETFTRQMEALYLQAWQEKSGASIDAKQHVAKSTQPEWIFINGMPRSGSTWCYNIVRELCTRNGVGNIIGYAGEGDDLDRALQSPPGDAATPRLIKFHSPTKLALEMLESGRARAVYSQRDPRDVVVSLMDFRSASFDHIYAGLPGLLQQHALWKQTANVQGLEYREIMEQPAACIRQVADWLGLACSEALVSEIADACSAESTRKQIEKVDQAVSNKEGANIQQVSDSRYYDTGTLLHANHISSGKIGRFRDRLSSEQIATLDAHLREWLIEEGYESSPMVAGAPADSHHDNPANGGADPRLLAADMLQNHLAVDPIVIAEIGARILGPESGGNGSELFHKLPVARVLAFEADAEACAQINAMANHIAADLRAYPHALGRQEGRQTLHITRDKMCSSLYPPNARLLERYAGLEVAQIEESTPIDVISLDGFMQEQEIDRIDFIKVDVQGAELDIFNGASRAMPQLLGACAEVEFAELYEGQPLFGEVDTKLREYGLQLHHFTDTGQTPLNGADFHGKTQLLWADAIYFPSLESVDRLPPAQLLKLAVLASLYEAYDLSQYALGRYDQLTGQHLKDEYTHRMTAAAKGEKASAQPTPAAQESNGRKALRIENDLLVTVPDDLNLMTPYILEEQQDWFEDEIKFTRHLIKPGMQIIDIGANYGCYALTMAKLAGAEGRLWAFEPCSATADHLEESIRTNGLGQLQLIRAALSNRQGTATLSTQENAELNSLTSDNGGTDTETVPLYRLDDCMQEYGWRNIDFMKLDAEGEEIRILEGGADFFRRCSPLVMFELKHGATVNEGLIQAFRDMAYGIYKLIPGLNLLVPFDPTEEPDPFQLNLFGCKRDRAEQLQAAGLLSLDEDEGELQIGDTDAWADYLKQSPYAAPLIEQWQAAETGLPGEAEYRTALNAYALAQRAKGTPESYAWLRAAFIQLIMALEAHASLPRLLTLARIATDLGRRSAAAQALHQFVEVISHEQKFNPVEPFLAASARAAAIDPAGELANWCLAQALAERERLQAFSSYFTGSGSVSALNIIANLNYQDPEMARRRELIARRFAQ